MKNVKIVLSILLLLSVDVWGQSDGPDLTISESAPESSSPPEEIPANAPAGNAKDKKSISVRFADDELIAGDPPKPEVNYLSTKDEKNFKKLIQLRENFIPEAHRGRTEFTSNE